MKTASGIELLAPAKNLEYGITAINCGADAVYIGADKFGARYAAGNSIDDIAALVEYAHRFNARVYVTLNTILFENELEQARELAFSLCDIGVDAFIVQDMAYMMFNLPIQLHASTQMAAYTLERVKFLDSVGFDRIVIERALSGEEIAEICKECDVEIEAFVHGAICVSYSGACYMGHIVSERSGNRGICSQPCRSKYNLYDDKGVMLIKNKHFLSVKDYKLSEHIGEMIRCGVRSFKIEGRLKDILYLKNTVLHYRREIDKYLNDDNGYISTSVGKSVCKMQIDLNKSFTRGFSDYYFKGKINTVGSFNTGKAVGEYMGKVIKLGRESFEIDIDGIFGNGDGICFLDDTGDFTGTNINITKGNQIFPNRMDGIVIGTEIYRNFDIKYSSKLEKEKIQRKISVDIILEFQVKELKVSVTDSTGCEYELKVDTSMFDTPRSVEKANENIIEQFKKSGDTIFEVESVTVKGEVLFIPISIINKLRRELLGKLSDQRLKDYKGLDVPKKKKSINVIGELNYKANVTNSLAERFYKECGYSKIEMGLEVTNEKLEGCEAMIMKYCLRDELGECLIKGGEKRGLFLENNGNYFEIATDCGKCEMKLIYLGKNYFNKK